MDIKIGGAGPLPSGASVPAQPAAAANAQDAQRLKEMLGQKPSSGGPQSPEELKKMLQDAGIEPTDAAVRKLQEKLGGASGAAPDQLQQALDKVKQEMEQKGRSAGGGHGILDRMK